MPSMTSRSFSALRGRWRLSLRFLLPTLLLAVTLAVALPLALMPGPKIRTYFIASEDSEWDYAPQHTMEAGLELARKWCMVEGML